jgi:type IV secretory pathway VirB2 component (pilin)
VYQLDFFLQPSSVFAANPLRVISKKNGRNSESVKKLSYIYDTMISYPQRVSTMRKKVSRAKAIAITSQQTSVYRVVGLSLLTIFMLLIMMSQAHALVTSAMGNALCSIVEIVYGNLGRGLATLAVIIVGVGATLGKTSWGLAMTVAVGIAVMFNAHNIVSSIGAGSYAVGCMGVGP